MFVALRDLRHARGRFLLVGAVVALLGVLVGFLSGLTGGLAEQNVSAVLSLPADRVVVATEGSAEPGYATSSLTSTQVQAWTSASGVVSADPLGITQLRASAGDASTGVAVLGSDVSLDGGAVPPTGSVVLSAPAAEALGVGVGGTVTIAGVPLTVAGTVGDEWYSHTAAVYVSLDQWRSMAAATGDPGALATALLVRGTPDWSSVEAHTSTASRGTVEALMLLPAFRSEIGSLGLIVALLFGISALVVGAFFTVWTMQRRPDIAVLKALGADDRTLRRDALGQALVVLVGGIGVAMAVVVVGGLAVRGVMPFLLSPWTTVLPAALMVALGLAGAAVAVRSIATADPVAALGAAR